MVARRALRSAPMGSLFASEAIASLSGMLRTWRTDEYYQTMEKEGAEGRILGFVKGLHLSAQLIYRLRLVLSSYDVEVDWGHLVDEKQQFCSRECDIIIHMPGYLHKWNGDEHPIMDFRFIKSSAALAVISCKSLLKSVDKEYCRNIKQFKVNNIFLFAECCSSSSVKTLEQNSKKAGYKGLCYAYTVDSRHESIVKEDPKVYERFLKAILRLTPRR